MKSIRHIVTLMLLSFPALAQAADGPLLNLPLSNLPANPEMLVLEVTLAPGQASSPHRHNAHVFVYMLEGEVTMQVAGGEPVVLTPGQMFYENPVDIHSVSRNNSSTEPAKFLVHILKSIGVPVSTAVSAN